jgi:hypothetical protein
MGMDVYGQCPKNKAGEYFRANCWSWRPIHAIMEECHDGIIDDDTMLHMSCNDGAGLETDSECQSLAWEIELHLNGKLEHIDSFSIDCGILVEKEPTEHGSHRFVPDGNPKGVETMSAYQCSREHVMEFVTFLRNCGGFEVW